jgi:hypothetical protein
VVDDGLYRAIDIYLKVMFWLLHFTSKLVAPVVPLRFSARFRPEWTNSHSAPWRMDGGWTGKTFPLGSTSLGNLGG